MIHALSGGVGGARLVVGLSQVLSPSALRVVVNTADDFDYLGLHIMPDLDSVLYALAGVNDKVRGWGRDGESWAFRDAIGALGGENWFALGDKDLAVHVLRTHWLRQGASYAEVAKRLAARFGIFCRVIPMTDDEVATVVLSGGQSMSFQDYFVRRQCAPRVDELKFAGIDTAVPHAAWFDSLQSGRTDGVIICPSNPFLSVEPILALKGVRDALKRVPVVAVSPIVGGQAIKGPAAKMMQERGLEISPIGIAQYYGSLIDGILIDCVDASYAGPLRDMGLKVAITNTMMNDPCVSASVAETAISLVQKCADENREQD